MNLIEAIKSGKRFKLKRDREWHTQGQVLQIHEARSDLICDNWEIEEEKIEITRSQLQEAFNKCSFQIHDLSGGFPNYSCRIDLLAKELGFTESEEK